MRRGHAENVQIWFATQTQVQSLRTSIILSIDGIAPVAWDIGQFAEACRNLLSGHCPASLGENLIQRLQVPIPPAVASRTSAKLRITTVDHLDDQQFCVEAIITIE